MTQQERSGLNEAAEISVRAAGAVRGAIKTGKMVSGAAKGAAAAGPYGAAAAILWTHRKAVAAIIAGLLVLPVLFIMLLPSLIFGGLTKAGVEGSPDTPILNDNAAIVENINQISQAISDLLEEGQEDVRTRVDADFTASGADQKEIINPYESSPSYNANRFIAMYCAAKDQDYASISLKDMETLIRKAKDALYTFTSTEESRTTTVTETNTDPKTGKVTVTETEVTEIWKIYTIVYNGEAYFEDTHGKVSPMITPLSVIRITPTFTARCLCWVTSTTYCGRKAIPNAFPTSSTALYTARPVPSTSRPM